MARYSITIKPGAMAELKGLRKFDAAAVLDAIEAQLSDEPTVETANRKCLPALAPTWEGEIPVWELRVGAFRVFYDVDEDAGAVYVRAVRKKGRKTTGEIV